MDGQEREREAKRLREEAARLLAEASAGDKTERLAVADALAAQGQAELALELASQGALALDPQAACRRAGYAILLRQYDYAIAATDIAIGELLHEGVSVADFMQHSLRGAQPEGLMRFERDAVARVGALHEPFALRWEALRRAGRTEEARELRAVCLHHFPDRASVWSTAGNQSLDEQQVERAEGYFDRALELDPNWSPALAGKAIVFETRKDWAAALGYRERVVRNEHALEREDPASLQRVIRLAAALARIGRWNEAGALLRRCVSLTAFERLPAERPMLLRAFSVELYAPAVLAMLFVQVPAAFEKVPQGAVLGLREAQVLGRLFPWLEARKELEPADRLMQLGMCAWLASDVRRAYSLFDEVEVHREGDLATQCLLACSAALLCASQLPSIVKFALEAARSAVAGSAAGASDDALFYALVILALFGEAQEATAAAEATAAQTGSLLALLREARARAAAKEPCPELPAPDGELDLDAQLRRLCTYRLAQLAAGRSALDAAGASAEAVAALAAFTGPSSSPSR